MIRASLGSSLFPPYPEQAARQFSGLVDMEDRIRLSISPLLKSGFLARLALCYFRLHVWILGYPFWLYFVETIHETPFGMDDLLPALAREKRRM